MIFAFRHCEGEEVRRLVGAVNNQSVIGLCVPLQAAARAEISTSTLKRAIQAGELKAIRVGERAVRLKRADVTEWLAEKAKAAKQR